MGDINSISAALANEFSIAQWQADNTIELIDEGNTIPFIARYRKERTGALSDDILREFYDRLNYLRSLASKKRGNITSYRRAGAAYGGGCGIDSGCGYTVGA